MKIVFITVHNWITKRQGGFHLFAREAALRKNDVVFFSFPRPYYGLFLRREQINADVVKRLSRGEQYKIESNGKTAQILNVTFPTFRLPDKAGRFLGDKTMIALATRSLFSFEKFADEFLRGADCFVFESCEGIYLLPKIKQIFPSAKIVYRPSDPLVFDEVPPRLKKAEREILKAADIVLLVNEEGREAYKKEIPDFDEAVRYKILPNGVDIAPYLKKHPVPEMLQKKNTALYVGAWQVEWNLIFECAQKMSDVNFVIVCPNYPDAATIERAKNTPNIFYVDGIAPTEVPAWITNCSAVIVPYMTDFYKDRPLGITAKYYQAMSAQKPIVAYCDTPKLADLGIDVAYTYADFMEMLKRALAVGTKKYSFDLRGREWKTLCDEFMKSVE